MSEDDNTFQNSKNLNERNILTLTVLGSIVFGFIPALIVWFVQQNEFSEYAKTAIKRNLNFEIIIYLFIFLITAIPIVNFLGMLVAPIAWVINIIICIKAYKSIDKHEDYVYPITTELIK